jgi:predicted Zn-dependent protease with MMP-like domain
MAVDTVPPRWRLGPPSGSFDIQARDPAAAYGRRVQPVSPQEFEGLVADALDTLPTELAAHFDNVVVVVEDEHPEDPDILGLYDGVALTERVHYTGALPDRISLYRIPLCLMAEDYDHLVEEIAITVVHEFAHHMGIDDHRLHALGWD